MSVSWQPALSAGALIAMACDRILVRRIVLTFLGAPLLVLVLIGLYVLLQ